MQMVIYGDGKLTWKCDRCSLATLVWHRPPDPEGTHWLDVRMTYIGLMKESWEAAKQQGWVEQVTTDGLPLHFCPTCVPTPPA